MCVGVFLSEGPFPPLTFTFAQFLPFFCCSPLVFLVLFRLSPLHHTLTLSETVSQLGPFPTTTPVPYSLHLLCPSPVYPPSNLPSIKRKTFRLATYTHARIHVHICSLPLAFRLAPSAVRQPSIFLRAPEAVLNPP